MRKVCQTIQNFCLEYVFFISSVEMQIKPTIGHDIGYSELKILFIVYKNFSYL